MKSTSPNLMTLLGWADRLAAGERCADWEAWCASSPAAAERWERIEAAEELLDDGDIAVDQESEICAEEIAAFLDGGLPVNEARRTEESCWQSSEALVEAVSTVRFARQTQLARPTAGLEERLLKLQPLRLNGITSAATHAEAIAPIASPNSVAHALGRNFATWQWLLAAAALFLAAAFSGGVGWLIATRQRSRGNATPIASSPAAPQASPTITDREPEQDPQAPRQSASPAPPVANRIVTGLAPKPQAPAVSPPANKETIPDELPPSAPPPPISPHIASRSPSRAAMPLAEVTFRSAQGLMLIEPNGQGKWRVAQGRLELYEPVRVVSLAESWTSIEIPRFGTLIWEGAAEGKLSVLPDGLVEVGLTHGKLAIQDLAAEARVRFETSGATWTARSLGERATLAVVDDPLTPSLIVSHGAVAVENVQIPAGQSVRWQEGVPLAPQASVSADGVGVNLAWMQPPDEKSQKQWNVMFGRLIEKVSAADDARAELNRLLTISKDPRQAALLAQWNVSVADQAARGQQTWSMLTDRREALRIAGVRFLMELAPGSTRLTEFARSLRQQLGDDTAQRVVLWLATARQPGQLPAAQAAELAEYLGHGNLAVRQLAVSLLELHIAPAFQKGLFQQPAYDAAAAASRRAAAQAEWRLILRQLYTPTRRNPAGASAILKPIQPSGNLHNATPSTP